MSATGEYFLRMRENDFNALTEQQRNVFSYIEKVEINEYENHKSDPNYIKLYKEKKKATDNLKKYLFNKKHKL